ncbi:DUF6286 domain-containing protein [Pseudonocardia endophytica]|uniref:DUF6286 domain-containing protein n=1 Tax=Pseudonocardia endophytica TaxID=401976 RepID=A0A4R1I4F9_PSEEN|nr:DUF6286 domain-containing protein [Pseudonocardia endophytica]TCK24912.1 hypothetical protein EV378_0707 [Pseudonocardia endophytica]
MRVLLRVLAPLLSLAVAALGVLVVVEVVAAWVTPGSTGLLVPWSSWRAVLEQTQWTATAVLWVAIGVGVVGLILVLVGLLARRHDVALRSPSDGITVTTAPRVLARLVGRRVRGSDQVSGATVTASAKKITVRAQGRASGTSEGSDVRSGVRERVDELLGELPLARTPRVSVSVAPGPKGPQ